MRRAAWSVTHVYGSRFKRFHLVASRPAQADLTSPEPPMLGSGMTHETLPDLDERTLFRCFEELVRDDRAFEQAARPVVFPAFSSW